MKISINWIKEFVNLDGIEPEELVKRFNLSTAEIEGVEYKGKDTSKVVFPTFSKNVPSALLKNVGFFTGSISCCCC